MKRTEPKSFSGLTDCKPFLNKSGEEIPWIPLFTSLHLICSDCFALVYARQLP